MMIKREYKQINFGKSDVGVACRGGNLFTMIENLTIVFRLKLTLLVSCIVHRETHIRLSYILDCLTYWIVLHIGLSYIIHREPHIGLARADDNIAKDDSSKAHL